MAAVVGVRKATWLLLGAGAFTLVACGRTHRSAHHPPLEAGGASGESTPEAAAGVSGDSDNPLFEQPLDGMPIYTRVERLTNSQFEHAVVDILRLPKTTDLKSGLVPPAEGLPGFTNDEYNLFVDQKAAPPLEEAAEKAAALATGSPEALARLYAGTDAAGFVRELGRRAFRRPLTEDEVASYSRIFARGEELYGAGFANGAALVIRAMLGSPSFLYRTELGPRTLTADASGEFPDTTLTADEVATQLGFTLLGSTPDAGLMAAADSGALATTAGMAAEVDRLLSLPATQANVTAMVGRWLDVDRLADHVKDISLLSPLMAPDQDQTAIAAALRASWDQAVNATLWSNPAGKVNDLLTSQAFYADWRLATLYGLPHGPASDPTLNALSWPAAQPRAGILTHPALLWALSDPASVNPVKRGQAIHRDVVCEDPVLPDPPLATAEALAVIKTGDSEATHSDARLASGKLCADNCHSELDPYGRQLHAFDPVGNFRTVDEVGRAIDTSATLTARSPLGPMTVSGPAAFAQALVSSNVFAGCAAQRLFEAVLDVVVPTRDACQLADLRERFYQHLQAQELGFFDGQQTGQLMSRATVDLQSIRFFLGYGSCAAAAARRR